MHKKILRLTIISAIALAGIGSSPATARDNAALGKFLFGGLAFLIISDALSTKASVAQHGTPPKPKSTAPKRFPTKGQHRKVLPAECERVIETQVRRISIVSNRCLNRNYHQANRLPEQCHRKLQKRNGRIIRGYKTRCLKHHGYHFQW
jgi:hypothetical protein